MPKENFYLLLELSLNENNIAHIDTFIKDKQAEWSRLRSHPTKGRMAQQYLDLIPEIRKVMSDKKLRQLEATEAKRIIEQKRTEKFKELDEYIKILSAKGKIFEEEFQKLVQTFPTLLEFDIRKRIRVAIVRENKPKYQNIKLLDQTTVKVIADDLKIVGKSSLYDFLNLYPTSNLKTLQKRTRDKDADIKKIAHKDAKITASNTLIGHCQYIFNTKEMREAYDASLAQQRLIGLDKAIEVACWTGRVQAQEYELLFKKAISLGLNKEKASEYILEFCQKKHCSVEITGKSIINNMQSCGTCNFLNTATARHCENCGYPLKIKCPHCHTENASTVHCCHSCGFAVGDMPNALPLLRKGKVALIEKNVDLAQQLLLQAEIFWPRYPEIVEALQAIQSEKQAIDEIVQELRHLIEQRYFYQARQTLVTLRQRDHSHSELSQGKLIEQRIEAAEKWLQKAKMAHKETELIDAYSTALAEAQDCQEAIEKMATLPPEPPTALKANVSHHAILLHWTSSISRGHLIYHIIRKNDGYPNNYDDGKMIGETSQTQLEDINAEAGQAYYYAIYTLRGKAFSNQATTIGSVILLAEIDQLQVIPGDSCLNFSWQIPTTKAVAIEVWRKKNSVPQQRKSGELVSGVRKDGVTDIGLKNDTLYGYLINLVFQDIKGNQFFSQGITCQSRPIELPQPVENLKIVKQNNHLDISWTPPSKGTVELFYSEKPIVFSKGESLPTSRLSELGKSITVQSLGSVKWPINFQGTIYIVPVTVVREIAIIGEVKMETSLNEVTHLQGLLSYNKLYLEWQWPPGAQKALVTYQYNSYPTEAEDASVIRQFITKEVYDKAAAFVIHQPEDNNYYFTVFVVAGDEKNRRYSKGQQCLVEKSGYQDIFYKIKTKKGLFGKIHAIQLILTTHGDIVTLPEVILVRKNNGLPLRRADGHIIHTLSNERIHTKSVINIPYQESYKNSYLKLFFTDKNNEQKYRLVAPSKNKLFLK